MTQAIKNFDINSDNRLWTYAKPYVIHSINNYQRGVVHIPNGVRVQIGKLMGARNKLEFEYGYDYSMEDVVELSGLTEEQIQSLDVSNLLRVGVADEDGNFDYNNLEVYPCGYSNPHQNYLHEERYKALMILLRDHLSIRERIIVMAEFDMLDKEYSRNDLSEQYKISVQRIGQIYSKAMKKLQTEENKSKLTHLLNQKNRELHLYSYEGL